MGSWRRSCYVLSCLRTNVAHAEAGFACSAGGHPSVDRGHDGQPSGRGGGRLAIGMGIIQRCVITDHTIVYDYRNPLFYTIRIILLSYGFDDRSNADYSGWSALSVFVPHPWTVISKKDLLVYRLQTDRKIKTYQRGFLYSSHRILEVGMGVPEPPSSFEGHVDIPFSELTVLLTVAIKEIECE